MPLIRSCYALAIVVSWFAVQTSSKMFLTYVIILFSGLYLGSLGFYVCETNVNPDVRTYWDALWWAVMEAITIGCNIEAVTAGQNSFCNRRRAWTFDHSYVHCIR